MRVALVNPRLDLRRAASISAAASRICRWSSATPRPCSSRPGTTRCCSTGQLWASTTTRWPSGLPPSAPDITMVPTAPSYLFWRCAPPELRVPAAFLPHSPARRPDGRGRAAWLGHPGPTLRKLGADAVVRGECEEVIVGARRRRRLVAVRLDRIARPDGGVIRVNGAPHASRFVDHRGRSAGPMSGSRRHRHHHHRFDEPRQGLGAEVEASRGCPYTCSFCAKIDYRDDYRRRDLPLVLEEIDRLIAQGVTTSTSSTRSSCRSEPLLEALVRAQGQVRRADAHRPVEAGAARRCSGGPDACRSRPASRA